jgi:hypothetical protein
MVGKPLSLEALVGAGCSKQIIYLELAAPMSNRRRHPAVGPHPEPVDPSLF